MYFAHTWNDTFRYFFSVSLGGCSVAPECYYINIRTGTHYFPKGTQGGVAHPLGIDNANRFKCALNRIDEKQAETVQTTDYKASVLRFLLVSLNQFMSLFAF